MGTTKSTGPRLALLGLVAVMVLGVPAAVVGYRSYTSRPAYLTNQGVEALQEGDIAKAKQYVVRLQMKGFDSAAHILQGKIFLTQAKDQLEKAPLPFPYEGMQRASQMVLSGAGLGGYPTSLRGLGWLAFIQVQQTFPRQISGADDLLDALEEFTQVMDNDPWAAEATVLASECLVRLGDSRSAELALLTLVNRQPDNLDAHRWLAAIYVDLNAGVPAAAHLREWIRLDPDNPHPYRLLCLITRDTEGGFQEAIQVYRQVLQLGLDPGERAAVLKELAETLIKALAEYQQALDTLAQAPQDFQDQPAILLLRAECLLGLAQGEEARRMVDGILAGHPNLTSALLFRAKIYLQDDQAHSAIPLLEKVVSLHPLHIQARQTLMLIYRSVRDEQRAAEQQRLLESLLAPRGRLLELQPVTANHPWNGSARLEMALLNAPINRAEALAWIRFALASNPRDPRIRKAWTQLVGYQPPPLLRDMQDRRQRNSPSD
jgi:tetratricopeptide (TPR) repeat protein